MLDRKFRDFIMLRGRGISSCYRERARDFFMLEGERNFYMLKGKGISDV
jgi:hypothetical protein